ncbi:PREDICTED: serine/threonine-protein kinase NLK [Cyprinodon variegatus]|uniref:serine/threonine-protein kinase NLK n=1 Tax=Cyprinodon variegatus TaxID=28743 RepID=UPI000742AF8D|nr:PREDICTED: serine/threonine-protein kinase NLK [Cyprinodon variegatus]
MALCSTTATSAKMMAAYNGGSSAVGAHHHHQLQHLPPPHMHHHHHHHHAGQHHLQHPGSAAAVRTVQQHTSTAAAAAVMLNPGQQQPYFPSPAPGQAPGPASAAAPAQVQAAAAAVKSHHHHHHHQQQQQNTHHLQPQLDIEPDRPIGYGAFGVVWSVTDPRDGKRVALKKMPNVFQNLVSCKRVFRELKMLCFFKHENVLSALDILQPPHIDYFEEIYVVTELMQSDLHKIIVSPQPLSSDHAKVFLYQILRGLKYLHSAGILHRDIKPGNLLVNSNCVLKICDFGLARVEESDESRHMTQEVVTQYYRAPEILMGSRHYTNSIDIWSVGCIFAELLGRRILFQAQSPIQQVISLESKRISAKDALAHPYLDEGRLRYHTCMCKCCYTTSSGRVYTSDFEPVTNSKFDDGFEKNLTSVRQVKEIIHQFILEQQKGSRVPLCINPQSAAFKSFISSTVAQPSEMPPSPLVWE